MGYRRRGEGERAKGEKGGIQGKKRKGVKKEGDRRCSISEEIM